jgi:uncharacterized protein (TIRG00374 family)
MPKPKPLRRKVSFLIRLIITVAGVGYLIGFKEWSQIGSALSSADFRWLLGAFAAYGLTTLLGILRWHLLLNQFSVPVGFKQTVELSMVGIFANAFMPGAMGGDIFKAFLAAKAVPDRKTKIVISIFMERVLGFIAMFLVSTGLILNRYGPLTTEPATELAVYLYFVAFFLILGLVALGTWKRLGQFIPLWNRLPFRTTLSEAGQAYQAFMRHKICFWGGLTLSIAGHFSLLATCWFVAKALQLELNFWDLGAVLPLIALVTLVLPSFGGLGVRELAFQHFLTYAMINKETSIALSLTFYAVTLAWSAIGGFIYLQYRGTLSTIEEDSVEDDFRDAAESDL